VIVSALAFTDHGMSVGAKLEGLFEQYSLQRCQSGELARWTETAFASSDALIYFGAAGIAVRAIAPYVKKKTTDPCVLVIDEQGRYVIPVLSGHIGGGNELALYVARIIGALPVITTATDINGLFSVDVWAVKQGLAIVDSVGIKYVSGKLIAGTPVKTVSEYSISGPVPAGICLGSQATADSETDLYIGFYGADRPKALWLAPKTVTAGIGCRKGIAQESVEAAFRQALIDSGLPEACVINVASIDLKKDEAGLVAFCREHGLPYQTYSAEELLAVQGAFSPSNFVRSVTGVENVCERSAVRHTGGRVLFTKHAYNGVTVAFAAADPELSWEEKE